MNYTRIMEQDIARLRMPKSLIRRTQLRDLIAEFVSKTSDNRTILVNVYQDSKERWYVVLGDGELSGWTPWSEIAFNILHNASAFTAKELNEMASKVKAGKIKFIP